MDPFTHALLGAVTATSCARRGQERLAAGIGFIAALPADLDILIRSSADPLLVLEYHRQFSHSLIFIPLGALLVSLLLWPLWRGKLSWRASYGYCLLGYGTAGLLDACTSYGTHLFWPFVDAPVAWSVIAVVDPLFTAVLLLGLLAAWRWRRTTWARTGLALAGGYLLLGFVQHQRALALAEDLAQERGLAVERQLVKPTMANLLLWRAVTTAEGQGYVDAVRVGLFTPPRVYPGDSAPLIDPHTWGDLPEDSRGYRDLQRFHRYAHQLLVAHPDDPRYIGDLRYAMLPTSVEPLWGLVLDPDTPEAAPEFVTRRDFTPAMRAEFTAMLRGRDLPRTESN